MSNEIEQYQAPLKAFNGRKGKATDEEITLALSPIFVAYPHFKATDEWYNLQFVLFRDLDPDKLARAVLTAIANDITGFPPAAGVIRKHAEDAERIPGPRSTGTAQTRPVPGKMFRLPDDEDKAERMARLRRTKDWRYV